MALRIRDEYLVPTGLYQSELAGARVEARTLEGLRQKVLKAMEQRQMAVPAGLMNLLVEENCRRVPQFCDDDEPPSLPQMLMNAGSALKRWALSGFKVTNEEEMVKRQGICGECKHWSGHAVFGVGRCMKCGCLGVKLGVATEKCPIGKW